MARAAREAAVGGLARRAGCGRWSRRWSLRSSRGRRRRACRRPRCWGARSRSPTRRRPPGRRRLPPPPTEARRCRPGTSPCRPPRRPSRKALCRRCRWRCSRSCRWSTRCWSESRGRRATGRLRSRPPRMWPPSPLPRTSRRPGCSCRHRASVARGRRCSWAPARGAAARCRSRARRTSTRDGRTSPRFGSEVSWGTRGR